jgi:hypothetical protein
MICMYEMNKELIFNEIIQILLKIKEFNIILFLLFLALLSFILTFIVMKMLNSSDSYTIDDTVESVEKEFDDL